MSAPADQIMTYTEESVRDTDVRAVDALASKAHAAARPWARMPAAGRAAALQAVADALDTESDSLIALARQETQLEEARLQGELRRTTFQLRFFAEIALTGSATTATIDHADADWPMGAPRPDLRRHTRAVGPVVVFAAGNFPFAFSVAGGDTASGLAAGCPVIVKAHPGHPRLSRATAAVVSAALRSSGAPEGVFALVHGVEAGTRALRHPDIRAAAFTGSIRGGRALFDIASSREVPIPFYGELGSTNPVVVTLAAAEARAEEIASGFVASVTGSAGQLCTKPGLLLVPDASPVMTALGDTALPPTHPLLSDQIAAGFRAGATRLGDHPGVTELARASDGDARLFTVDAATFLTDLEALAEECFGPAALVVRYQHDTHAVEVLDRLPGQLTVGVMAEEHEVDSREVQELVEAASELAGRVLWNQWPTGVSVTWAQQHGGPYPATTSPLSTSVGAAAIDRFLRPVAYQNFPEALLPAELREATRA